MIEIWTTIFEDRCYVYTTYLYDSKGSGVETGSSSCKKESCSERCHQWRYKRSGSRMLQVHKEVPRRSTSSQHVVLRPSPPARSPQLPPLSRQPQRPCHQMQQRSLQASYVSSPYVPSQYVIPNRCISDESHRCFAPRGLGLGLGPTYGK